ncbi:MAG: tRNA (adenosine(37)-N6)-threonylcarbamoyltransferase complex ATPase subunit type 1 TsaE [Bacteroidales bacterium]
MNRIIINGLSDLNEAAEKFLSLTKEYSVIAFYGEMGAGKTTFITAICERLGVQDLVNSPTFTIVNEYLAKNNRPIYHFDFYRVEDLREVIDMGFEEYIYSEGLCLIEWPEKIEELIPEETLKVKINIIDDNTRVLEF